MNVSGFPTLNVGKLTFWAVYLRSSSDTSHKSNFVKQKNILST